MLNQACVIICRPVEIGWRLSTPWQGKGLAREAADAALKFAFDSLDLRRGVSFTVPANTSSWRLMERLGMRKIGEFEVPTLPEGHEWRRHLVYEITTPNRTAAEGWALG